MLELTPPLLEELELLELESRLDELELLELEELELLELDEWTSELDDEESFELLDELLLEELYPNEDNDEELEEDDEELVAQAGSSLSSITITVLLKDSLSMSPVLCVYVQRTSSPSNSPQPQVVVKILS